MINILKQNLVVLRNQKGGVQIAYDGYLYNKHKVESYRCQLKSKCPGMAIYKNGIFTLTVDHSLICKPNPSKIKATILKNKIKQLAENPNGFSPSQVVRVTMSQADQGNFKNYLLM